MSPPFLSDLYYETATAETNTKKLWGEKKKKLNQLWNKITSKTVPDQHNIHKPLCQQGRKSLWKYKSDHMLKCPGKY